MGKITGFLEIERQDRKYTPAADRVRHYNEFVIPLSEETVPPPFCPSVAPLYFVNKTHAVVFLEKA